MLDYGLTTRIEDERTLVLEKIFLAPKEKVFEMFTKNDHLEHFWSPHGWEMFRCSMDFKTGGEWFYGMTRKNPNPNEKDEETFSKNIFDQIDQPDQLIYHSYFTDHTGEIKREIPEIKTKMDFVDLDEERTIIVSRMEFEHPEALHDFVRTGMREGLAESWDRLSSYLAEQTG